MKLLLPILSLLMLCFGCQQELSVVEGISVHSARYQAWGQSPGTDRLRLWGHTLSDLGARSVSSEATMPEVRVISFLDSRRRFDVTITGNWQERSNLCRKMLTQTFGVRATQVVREIDVLILVPMSGRSVTIEPVKVIGELDVKTWPREMCRHGLAALLTRPQQRVTHTFESCDMDTLASWLDGGQDKVVLNETNLSGAYNFQLIDNPRSGMTVRSSLAALGLELRPARRAVSAIYIDSIGQEVPQPVAQADQYRKTSRTWWDINRRERPPGESGDAEAEENPAG
jgi:uncharacterized protein (TIGR03435 family)